MKTHEEKIKTQKESLYKYYNSSFILIDFTASSELFSEKFKKWVKEYNSGYVLNKLLKTLSKENPLAEILHPNKSEEGNKEEKEYICELKKVLEDLTDLIVENKKPDSKEMEKLVKAFYCKDLKNTAKDYVILTSLLIMAAGVYNFYKNNNNKKVAVSLILLEIFTIALYHLSQDRENSKQN